MIIYKKEDSVAVLRFLPVFFEADELYEGREGVFGLGKLLCLLWLVSV